MWATSDVTATIFLTALARAQRSFFQGRTTEAFETLLEAALMSTDSEFGFIAEVFYTPSATPYLKTHAFAHSSANPATREFFRTNPGANLEFSNLNTLFGALLTSEEPVISNSPDDDPRAGGNLPKGHPPLRSFLGVPLKMNGALVGAICLANRPSYDEEHLRLIDDFQQICASLIVASTQQRLKERAERAQRESEQRLNAIVQSMVEGLITMDGDGTIQSANAAAEHYFGWTEKELLGKNLSLLLTTPGRTDAVDIKKFLPGASRRFENRREAVGKKRDGTQFPVELSVSPISAAGHNVPLFVGLIRDITSRKRQEEALYLLQEKLLVANEKLAHNADTDALTGIGNRRYFDDHFPGELKRAARTEQTICLFLMDVDFFKNYNDHYGHQRGDECLKAVAKQAASALNREGEFLARIGGEEFAGLLPGTMNNEEEYRARIQTIIDQVRDLSIQHDTSTVAPIVTASAGAIILKPEPGFTPEDLLNRADRALYRAKQEGRDRVVFAPGKLRKI